MVEFEWNEIKADTNFRRHGVSFEDAIHACIDPFALEWIDIREKYGEERSGVIGLSKTLSLFVAYAERGNKIRIISARRATRHEQDDYYRQNAP